MLWPSILVSKLTCLTISMHLLPDSLAFMKEVEALLAVRPASGPSSSPSANLKSLASQLLAEFQNVVPDLPKSLPPSRDIHHVIDITPGASPPSKPTYLLPYHDTDELKKKLADLMKHGFARSSKSLYGAPARNSVFFIRKKDGSMRM